MSEVPAQAPYSDDAQAHGVRRRRAPWRRWALLGFVVFLGLGTTAVLYARHQWRTFQTAIAAERWDEATAKANFCLRVWPANNVAQLQAARMARKQHRFTEAERHLKEAMQLQGGASEATQLEFLLLRAQSGEVEEVAPTLFRYIEGRHPETPEIYQTIARGFIHHLLYGPALNCLNQWLEEYPDTALAYHWRGWVMERLDSAEAARQNYEKALDLDPSIFTVRLRLAEMFLEDKRLAQAMPHLEWLHERYPDRAIVLARLGQARFHAGNEREAKELMLRAVAELPNDTALLLHLGKVTLTEAPVEAERWLRQCLAVDPSDTEAQYMLVQALQRQKRRQEAEEMLAQYQVAKARLDRANKLLQEEAKNPSLGPDRVAEIGQHLFEVGQPKQAIYWLNKALERDPEYQLAHRLLAEHYEKKGDTASAAQHRRRLLPPTPKAP